MTALVDLIGVLNIFNEIKQLCQNLIIYIFHDVFVACRRQQTATHLNKRSCVYSASGCLVQRRIKNACNTVLSAVHASVQDLLSANF